MKVIIFHSLLRSPSTALRFPSAVRLHIVAAVYLRVLHIGDLAEVLAKHPVTEHQTGLLGHLSNTSPCFPSDTVTWKGTVPYLYRPQAAFKPRGIYQS